MQVILESSAVVGGDWHFEHNAAQALLAAVDRGEIEVIVPRLVFQEVINAYKEQAAEKQRKLQQARAAVEAMKLPTARSEQRSDEFDLEPEIAYRADLWRTLTNSGVRLLDLPDVAHRDLVERALARRAPFDDRGQAGYRDALIWHNLLEIAASGQMVIFVTNDGDFLDRNDRTQLHPDLVQDVRVAGLDPTRIRPVGSLKEAVNEVIEPGAEDPRLSARSIGKRRELEGRSVLPAPGASRGRGQPRRVRR
jgi:predicted nucleic acid-binding protein